MVITERTTIDLESVRVLAYFIFTSDFVDFTQQFMRFTNLKPQIGSDELQIVSRV